MLSYALRVPSAPAPSVLSARYTALPSKDDTHRPCLAHLTRESSLPSTGPLRNTDTAVVSTKANCGSSTSKDASHKHKSSIVVNPGAGQPFTEAKLPVLNNSTSTGATFRRHTQMQQWLAGTDDNVI